MLDYVQKQYKPCLLCNQQSNISERKSKVFLWLNLSCCSFQILIVSVIKILVRLRTEMDDNMKEFKEKLVEVEVEAEKFLVARQQVI